MDLKSNIEAFIKLKNIAMVGVSSRGNRFSNAVFRELKDKGYNLLPVNPRASKIGEEQCYPDLAAITGRVEGVLCFTPKESTLEIIRQGRELGINHFWIQQGAESEEVEKFCREQQLDAVVGRCIMMFAPPVKSVHKFHRSIWRLFGLIPK